MAASPLSQCAETTRIAVGLPSSLPSPEMNCRAGLCSIGKVGAPCDTKIAGNRSTIAPTDPLRYQHWFGLALAFHGNIPGHLHASFDALKVLERKAGTKARSDFDRRGEP